MKISVLMTTYNDANRLLRQSIESVLNQSRKCDEFVIVNDGSTDNTEEIIQEYQKKHSTIVFINRKENKGRIYSLNEGLEACSGDLVFINDADDFSLENRFEETIDYYNKIKNKSNIGAIGSRGYLDYGDRKKKYYRFLALGLKPISKFQIYYNMPFIHSSCAYAKNALMDIGGFPSEVSSCIDFFAITKIAAKYDVYGINKYLVVRNVDGKNFFAQKKNQKEYEKNLSLIDIWKESYYPNATKYGVLKSQIKRIGKLLWLRRV